MKKGRAYNEEGLGFYNKIIPVYQTKIEWVQRCVNSILSGKQSNVEIILVDDGNDSEYVQILSQLENEQVVIVHKKHEGVSAARNAGVLAANGDYIGFADADDEVCECYLEEAVNKMEKYALDIVVGGIRFQSFSDIHTYKEYHIFSIDQEIMLFDKDNIAVILENIFADGFPIKEFSNFINGSVCHKLYKRSLIKKIKFDERIFLFEDRIFNLEVFAHANKIGITSSIWYVYYQHWTSTIHSYKNGTLKNAALCFEHCEQIVNKFPEVLPYACRWYMSNIYTSIYLELLHKQNNVKFFEKSRLFRKWLKSEPWITVSTSFDYSILPLHTKISGFLCTHKMATTMLVYYCFLELLRKNIEKLVEKGDVAGKKQRN